MKYISIGIVLTLIAFTLRSFETVVSTEAAIKTVNGGGAEYQANRLIANLPHISETVIVIASISIIYGIVSVILSKKTKA